MGRDHRPRSGRPQRAGEPRPAIRRNHQFALERDPYPCEVSLPPSHEPPPGSATDLAFAAAILILNGVFHATALDGVVLVGELGLDGSIRPVRGELSMVAAARADLGTVVDRLVETVTANWL